MDFANLALLLTFTCLISLLVYLLRFPLVLGYILVGVLIGPYAFNFVENSTSLELFSKIGIVSLLFIIGLNLSPKTIKEGAKESLVLGFSQILITTLCGFLIFYFLFHFALFASLLMAAALTLSSTIIVLKIISDKGDINRLYAKLSLGVLLIQDFFAAILLLILSIVYTTQTGSIGVGAILGLFGIKILVLILIYIILNKWVLKKISKFFASSQELLLLFSMSFAFLYAYLFEVFGFSLELGALFAGIILSSSTFAKEIASRFRPIRDFFIILFFIILGMGAEFNNLAGTGGMIVLLSCFVIVINPLILFLIMSFFRHRARTSFLTALTMGQVSEFSLVVLAIARSFGYIDNQAFAVVLIVMFISICFSSYLILYSEKIYKSIQYFLEFLSLRKSNKNVAELTGNPLDLVVFGYDRVGRNFLNLATEKGYEYLIVDIDPEAILRAEKDGAKTLFGDLGDLIFLEENQILEAKMIVSTVPNFALNLDLIEFYKKEKAEEKIIIVVAHNEAEAHMLYKKGADYVLMPYQIGGEMGVNYIKELNFDKEKFNLEKEKHLEKILKLI